jgi:ribonuclease J
LTIKIFRGQNQIGGSIIEVSSNSTKIILDAGSELEENVPIAPKIEGLFSGKASFNAVFISHYHGDHLGLCDKILPEIPVYIGKSAANVTNAARNYVRKPEYNFAGYYESEKPFIVGDMVITPYLCDHSAFDAYMFHVACNGKTLLYTGDFRSHGRKSFHGLLNRLPSIDVLITEGTNLSRTPTNIFTEKDLEQEAVRVISKTKGPIFVLMAGTNIDRLVSIYKATSQTNRTFLQDLYLAAVSSAAGGKIPHPNTFQNIRVFLMNNTQERYTQLQSYGEAKIDRQSISKLKFVMCVRPSMRTYLEKLSTLMPFENGLLIYSMWEGYKKNEDMATFFAFMQKKGVKVVSLNTSGHADNDTIDALIQKVQPKTIIPVHTINSDWFDRYHDIRIIKSQTYTF